MSKLSSYKRIITSDFKEDDRELVEKIAGPINSAFNELYFAVNGRLDIRNNFSTLYKELDIEVGATGNPLNRTIFTADTTKQILGITVISAVNKDNTSTYPTGQPFISYTIVEGGILINNITGLQANNRYSIRVLVWS